MIKKYFALSLISATIAMAGCSSDSDSVDTETETETETETTPATPGVGGTAFDTIVNSDAHTTLEAAITTAGLADALDDPASAFTIFAPTDAAFTALDNDGDDSTLTTTELLLDENRAALIRILQYHVIGSDVSSTAVSQLITDAGDGAATAGTLLVDGDTTQVLTFTASDAPFGVSVNDIAIDAVDVVPADEAETQGRVHVVGSILLPPAAPVVEETETETETETEGEGTGTGETSGAVDEALAAAGGFDIFRNAINRDFGGNLDTSAWTVFVPSDTVLAAAGLTDLTAAEQQNHIVSDGANDPTQLAGLSTIRSSSNGTYAVVTSAGTTTVNGFAVELIATGAGGAQIYSVAGVLAP